MSSVFRGRITDAGGGEVRVHWDRDQLVDYPPIGAYVEFTVVTPPDRWTVKEAEHSVAGLSWDLFDGGEYRGSFVSIDAAIHIREVLNHTERKGR